MKSAEGLVKYAVAQLGKPYWWGSFGETASPELLERKRRQYPNEYAGWDYSGDFGKKVHDCCGLIKGYRWCESPEGSPVYKAGEDVAVAGLYAQCSQKGSMATMPDEPGILLFRRDLGQVGVYIGGGRAVEAMGRRWGVVETELSRRNWYSWGKPDWISYGENTEPPRRPAPTYYYNVRLGLLKPGMEDFQVRSLQALLQSRGFDCPESGIMDEKTCAALRQFQTRENLLCDGEAGGESWTRLLRG